MNALAWIFVILVIGVGLGALAWVASTFDMDYYTKDKEDKDDKEA